MLFRNRELTGFAAAFAGCALVTAALSWHLVGAGAAACVLGASVALGAVAALYTRRRYRDLANMAHRVDAVLHGERSLSLEHMSEGELSVLASELDKMVSRLNLAADELERKNVSLADSLADISHQLRTPLTALSVMCELVRRRLGEAAVRGIAAEEAHDLTERLRQMQRLQERVQWLVSVLLKLARIDAGVVVLERAPVDVAALAGEVADSLAVAFDLADVTLELDIQDGATFEGDASWSAEALMNVVKNCMEHAGAGGRVTVRAAQDALACRISVEDTGPGIAEKDLPHLFERFYRGQAPDRADAPSEVDPAGVGIGLSLAQSLVAAQGGAIKASNALDGEGAVTGARFDIVFFSVTV